MSEVAPERTSADIVALLSTSIGHERALALVDAATAKLGVEAERVSTEDALRVLEEIAHEPGLPGVTARFAKTRVHLRWHRAR